jgi:hypothetical protein
MAAPTKVDITEAVHLLLWKVCRHQDELDETAGDCTPGFAHG